MRKNNAMCQTCKWATPIERLNECDYCKDKSLLYCNACIRSDECNVFCNQHIPEEVMV